MNLWIKALIGGVIVETVLLLISSILLIWGMGPFGPEGVRADFSEYIQFPGCQLMEKAAIKSNAITFILMSAINIVFWTIAMALYLGLRTRSKKA